MNLLELIAGPLFKIIDKLVPDPQAKAQMQLDILKLHQAGAFKELDAELQRDLAQIDVNKVEAADPSLFKSGWRPATGWICVIGLFYSFMGQPLLTWASTAFWHCPVPPTLDMGTLLTLLGGLLGLGGYRTAEKIKRVS